MVPRGKDEAKSMYQVFKNSDDTKEKCDLLMEWVLGDGDFDSGLLARVIVLENKMKLIIFLLSTVVVGLIGVFIEILVK